MKATDSRPERPTTEGRTRVFVHLDHGRSLSSLQAQQRLRQIFVADAYGYSVASEAFDLAYSQDALEGRVGAFSRKAVKRLLGFDVAHAWRNRRGISGADVIWTHTEHEHLAISLLKRAGAVPDVPVIAQSVWLWDSWAGMSWWRRVVYRRLLAGHALHTTLSPENARVAERVLGAPVHPVPFGVGTDHVDFSEPPERGEGAATVRVVALGSDRHRDWRLLADAAQRAPELEVKILSRRRAARAVLSEDVPNLTVISPPDVDAVREAYRWADVVVVPLKENLHVSGVTVCLEGIFAGRPVVASDTGGLRDYVGSLVDLVPVGDVAALVGAVRDAAGRSGKAERARAARAEVLRRGLTDLDYGWRHVMLTQGMLASDHSQVQRASEFRAVAPPGATRTDSTAGQAGY